MWIKNEKRDYVPKLGFMHTVGLQQQSRRRDKIKTPSNSEGQTRTENPLAEVNQRLQMDGKYSELEDYY
jgi:hypothetical protein